MPKRRMFRLHVPEDLQAWRAWRARIAYHERRNPRDSRTLRAWFARWDAYHAEVAKAQYWPWDKTCWESGIKPATLAYRWPALLNRSAENCFQLTKGD